MIVQKNYDGIYAAAEKQSKMLSACAGRYPTHSPTLNAQSKTLIR
jgi:hypothetical protein